MFGLGSDGEKVGIDLLVVDEALYAEFQKAGLDLVDLRPVVRPVS